MSQSTCYVSLAWANSKPFSPSRKPCMVFIMFVCIPSQSSSSADLAISYIKCDDGSHRPLLELMHTSMNLLSLRFFSQQLQLPLMIPLDLDSLPTFPVIIYPLDLPTLYPTVRPGNSQSALMFFASCLIFIPQPSSHLAVDTILCRSF